MDRRQKKSQVAIFNVLLNLLKLKRIDQISVQEIADHADLSRGTIYANFLDKYDILEKMILVYLDEQFSLCQNVKPDSSTFFFDVIELMMLFLKENSESYQVFLTHPDTYQYRNEFISRLQIAFVENSTSSFDSRKLNQTEIQFMCHGILGVMSWYVINSQNISLSEVTLQLHSFLEIAYLS